MTTSQAPIITQAPQPTLQIQRFYVKEKSFKAPYAPAIFDEEWKPEINVEMNVKNSLIKENIHEVIVQLNISARNQNRTAFSLEVQQAGIFKIEHIQEEALQQVLSAYCPNLLYPYASKAVADATVEASFPALTLAPVNFEALYQQRQQAANQTSGAMEQKEKETSIH
jgi:preprotein translocase subunit SecB